MRRSGGRAFWAEITESAEVLRQDPGGPLKHQTEDLSGWLGMGWGRE